MTIQELPVVCKCGHEWNAEIVVKAPLRLAVASMREIRCPKCGNGPEEVCMIGEKLKPYV